VRKAIDAVDAPWPIAAVVAAAGAGRRFGGRKLLAPWPGGTILAAVVRALVDGGLSPVVVVVAVDGHEEARNAREAGAAVVIRPASLGGDLGTSVAVGVRALEEGGWVAVPSGVPAHASGGGGGMGAIGGRVRAPAIAVALGDLPRLRAETVARLAAAWRTGPANGRAIVVPAHGGRRGHPVIFGPAHGEALAALGAGHRPRDVLEARAGWVREVAVEDAGVWRDVDRRGEEGAEMLIENSDTPLPLYDTTRIHAEAILEFALDRKLKARQ